MKKVVALTVSVMTLSLMGCVQSHDPRIEDESIRSEVGQSLVQSAAQAANALETLSLIQRARTEPAPSSLDETRLPEDLRRKATVEFTGPADELVKELATNIGYAFLETGERPSNPGLVNIDAHDESVAKILEDIGLQAQIFATVIVDPNLKRVEFRNESGRGATAAQAVVAIQATHVRHTVRRHHVVVAACSCSHTIVSTIRTPVVSPVPYQASQPSSVIAPSVAQPTTAGGLSPAPIMTGPPPSSGAGAATTGNGTSSGLRLPGE
jgi:defect in organelle trafficking protein DotD